MSLSIIVAMDNKGLIGREGKLPWHLPEDLKRFKQITMGHPIVMGRKTFESIIGASVAAILLRKTDCFAAHPGKAWVCTTGKADTSRDLFAARSKPYGLRSKIVASPSTPSGLGESPRERFTGKPLPGRENIVLTRDSNYHYEGVTVVHSFDEILSRAQQNPEPRTLNPEVFIIGGSDIFKLALPHASKIYLTRIDDEFEGDVFFPSVDFKKNFKVVEDSGDLLSEKEQLPYRFITLEKSGG